MDEYYYGESSLSTTASKCPSCRSLSIKYLVLSPELLYKRMSLCRECGTTWTTRINYTPLRYKQEYYT